MIDMWSRSRAPFARQQAARVALANGRPLTSRQLAARGSSWRAVMDLLADREIVLAGSNERAQVLYALA